MAFFARWPRPGFGERSTTPSGCGSRLDALVRILEGHGEGSPAWRFRRMAVSWLPCPSDGTVRLNGSWRQGAAWGGWWRRGELGGGAARRAV